MEKSESMWLRLDVGKDVYPQTSSQNVDLAVFKVRSINGVLYVSCIAYLEAD